MFLYLQMAKNGNKRKQGATLEDVDSLTPPKIVKSKGLAPVIPSRRSSRTTTRSDTKDDGDVSEIESSQASQSIIDNKVCNVSPTRCTKDKKYWSITKMVSRNEI